ncbi:MAG: hypothetical protein JNK58_01595 [Phycisphaerae bacterium]|nr:hypothetical protein [Phycisphaerae bacterium]
MDLLKDQQLLTPEAVKARLRARAVLHDARATIFVARARRLALAALAGGALGGLLVRRAGGRCDGGSGRRSPASLAWAAPWLIGAAVRLLPTWPVRRQDRSSSRAGGAVYPRQ